MQERAALQEFTRGWRDASSGVPAAPGGSTAYHEGHEAYAYRYLPVAGVTFNHDAAERIRRKAWAL